MSARFGCCLAKHELGAWFEGAERPDEVGYQPGPERGQESDADGAGVRVRQSGELAFSCVELTDDPLGEADQDPSELVEPDPVPGAVEELDAQLVLQAAQAPRDRRLAQMEPSRRSCDVLGLRYRQEHPEIAVTQPRAQTAGAGHLHCPPGRREHSPPATTMTERHHRTKTSRSGTGHG